MWWARFKLQSKERKPQKQAQTTATVLTFSPCGDAMQRTLVQSYPKCRSQRKLQSRFYFNTRARIFTNYFTNQNRGLKKGHRWRNCLLPWGVFRQCPNPLTPNSISTMSVSVVALSNKKIKLNILNYIKKTFSSFKSMQYAKPIRPLIRVSKVIIRRLAVPWPHLFLLRMPRLIPKPWT